MPRKPVNNRRERGQEDRKEAAVAYGYTFVNINLTAEDKEVMGDWSFSAEETLRDVAQFTLDGYKVSWSHDAKSDCHIVSLSAGDNCTLKVNRRKVLTARGSTQEKAWVVLMYKLDAYCEGGVFPQNERDFNQAEF